MLDSITPKARKPDLSTIDSIWLSNPHLSRLDSLKRSARFRIDSLNNEAAQTGAKIGSKVDSIKNAYQRKSAQLLSNFQAENDLLGDEAIEPNLTFDIMGQTDLEIPSVNERLSQLPRPDQLPNLREVDPTKVATVNLPGAENIAEFQRLGNITTELAQIKTDLKAIKKDSLTNSEKITELLEDRVAQRPELKQLSARQAEMQKLKKAQNEYLSKMEQYRDPQKLEHETRAKVKDLANEELSKQGEKLSTAQNKLVKAKRKYGQFEDIHNLPKRAVNPLSDYPFRERLFPGVTFQVSKPEMMAIDLAPQVYYRLRPHWDIGSGFVYRLNGDLNTWSFDQKHKMVGPKMFVVYRLFKSFYLRADVEIVHYSVPIVPTQEVLPTSWTTNYLGGIGKTFQLNRLVRGQTLAYYNFRHKELGPYPSKFLIRVGFDIELKKDQRRNFIRSLSEQINR